MLASSYRWLFVLMVSKSDDVLIFPACPEMLS